MRYRLNNRGDLAAAEVAFYAPALCLAAFILFKHGVKRQLGWFYIINLSILRIIGASTLLYIETANDYSAGLFATSAICSAIGTAPLLLALLGFDERLHEGMKRVPGSKKHRGLHRWVSIPFHTFPLAGLALAIVGGVFLFSNEPGTSGSNTGRALFQAGSIIFLVFYLSLLALTIFTFLRRDRIAPRDKTLLYACVISLPFLAVRISYSVTVAFSGRNSHFYVEDLSVWPEAFMMFLMEAIVISLYIGAGLLTPKKPVRQHVTNGPSNV